MSGSSVVPLEVEAKEVPHNQIKQTEVHNENLNFILSSITSDTLTDSQLEVARMIYDKSKDYGLDSGTTMLIAWCESRFRSDAKNPNSTATGVFQFIRGSWQYYGERIYGKEFEFKSPTNPVDNIDLALTIMSERGYTDWTASSHCWNKN